MEPSESQALRSRDLHRQYMTQSRREDQVSKFSQAARKLAHLKLSALQAETLRELLSGERTTTELTFTIFQCDYQDEQFGVYHGRVRRAMSSLEKMGLVAKTRLFGREKPFRLTQYGAAKILSVIPDASPPSIFAKADFVLFALVPVAGVVAWWTLHPVATNVFSLTLGVALFRSAQIVRRVI